MKRSGLADGGAWVLPWILALAILAWSFATPAHAQSSGECTADGASLSGPCIPLPVEPYTYQDVSGLPYGGSLPGTYETLFAVKTELEEHFKNRGHCAVIVEQPPLPVAQIYHYGALLSQQWGFRITLGNTEPCSPAFAGTVWILQSHEVRCPSGWNALASGGSYVCMCASTASCPLPPKCGSGNVWAGNPCNVISGDKKQREHDYVGSGAFPLTFMRSFSSVKQHFVRPMPRLYPMGIGWSATYLQSVQYIENGSRSGLYAYRPDGSVLAYSETAAVFSALGDAPERVQWLYDSNGKAGFVLRTADDDAEIYDLGGRLIWITSRTGITQTLAYDAMGNVQSVSDDFGHQLTFEWSMGSPAVLMSVHLPDGGAISFTYGSGNLTSVTYPDSTQRQYHYEQTDADRKNLLTGITDESSTRFATWSYDTSLRPLSSEHAGGVDRYVISYDNSTGARTVEDPLHSTRTYTTLVSGSQRRYSGVSAPCANCGESAAVTYATNGNVTSRVDFNNNRSCYAFEPGRNLETARVEGLAPGVACPSDVAAYTPAPGTRERKITTTWHSGYRLPTSIAEAGRTTTYSYDTKGSVLTRTVTDTATSQTRTWTYTYNTEGQVLTEDGPRTDVVDTTTFSYYACTTGSQCGQLHTATNALSQTTTFTSYNAHGQPLSVTDPNGAITTLVYDARQRLTSQSVFGETTTFTYWPTGLLKKTTLPDGSYVQYTYDGAHRLTGIEDGEGNHASYTLDNAGNRTAENVYDPTAVLARTRTQVFNSLGQLWKEIGASGTAAVTTRYGYDANGNAVLVSAPLGRETSQGYDELSRLKQIMDPGLGVTQFGYDARDNVVSITDPRNNVTSYTFNGFGDVTAQVSPDTGTTGSTFDSAGNVATSTDARNKTSTYIYDALNRVTSVARSDNTTTFSYDSATNGVGRLAGASDASHSFAYSYDPQGRVTSKTQVVGSVTKTVGYGYTNGNLTSIVTPSGQTISYGYSDGRVSSVALNGSVTVLDQVLYEPFGPVSGWRWGNSTLAARVYDSDGRIAQLDSAGLKTYTHDDASRITAIADADDPALNASYSYDELDRVLPSSVTVPIFSMTLSATTATAGDVVTVTVNNVPAGTGYWLALARSGIPSNRYNAWVAVTPTNGNFVWNVAMPSPAGAYEVRLFQSPFNKIRTSDLILVSNPVPPASPILSVESNVVPAGTTSVTVHLSNGLGGGSDWFALAQAGAPYTSLLQWTYVGGGVTSRDWTVAIPTTTGDYEIRLFLNNGYALAASTSIRLTSDPPVPAGTGGGPPTGRPYDVNGNRTFDDSSTYTTAGSSNRLFTVSGAVNRTYSYDLAGNVTSDGTRTFTYNDAGRLVSVSGGAGASYVYNALGQRVKKLSGGTALYFVYDESGHLLGEYSSTGALVQETIWLGDIPVATLRPNGSGGVNVYYVHTDHLNTPRRISRPADNIVVWRWDSDAFGATAANADPDGDSVAFTYGLRFAGQYFDAESGLHYNYYRDGFDPAVGRYTQSDPVGLAGGINPYLYADGNPILYVDPLGLWALGDPLPQGVVNSVAGFGDGVYKVVTLGIGDLNDLRKRFDIDGGVDVCSTEYGASKYAGMAVGTVALGGATGRLAFRPGGFANSNRYLRMGFGRKGGNETFRAAGRWVEKATGKPHVDIWPGGKL